MSEQVQSIVDAVRNLSAEPRRELVEAIQGKYRNVPTSSESFMGRKREDLALES